MNPLLEKFDTPFGTVPFTKIKDDHYLEAFKESIEIAKVNIEKIKDNSKVPDFLNVIEALENSQELVDRTATVFFNVSAAETNDNLQSMAKEISPLFKEFSNDIILDQLLFEKINVVYQKRESLDLNVEQITLLEKSYRHFIRNGAKLNDQDKEKLRAIDKELAGLSLEFGDNLLAETNSYTLEIDNIEDLSGLPESLIEQAAALAQEKGKSGKWLFTLDAPSYVPFMKYVDNRSLRETLCKAFYSRCFKGNDYDNRLIVKKVAKLRFQRAKLLGYDTHAHFVLEERMAQRPEKAIGFLDDLKSKAYPFAKAELEAVTQFAKKLGGPDTLESWDLSYYAEKLKKEKFDIDDEMLRPYFRLEAVVEGVFTVANKLYGISFNEIDSVEVYHPDVKTYEVQDKVGNHVGIFYADFFPRSGKRNGAWMTQFIGQKRGQRPHISIVCNFTKPVGSKPSLLTFMEVTTLFHEFGHALHGLLSKCQYESTSGNSVYWDFVELPSQILENWTYEKECLDLFACHYETKEKIPRELIKKIKESSSFLEGLATMRQLSFGMLDMGWHAHDPSEVEDIDEYEKKNIADVQILPVVEGSNISTSMGHIFRGGYSAGYYSYKWAEVLDADAFEYFLEKGIFNTEVAESFYENILSKGGSEHPMILYKRFRGKEPTVDALLKRAGLI